MQENKVERLKRLRKKDKTLKVFNGDNGGSQHCHMDYLAPVVPYMADWMSEKLS